MKLGGRAWQDRELPLEPDAAFWLREGRVMAGMNVNV